jgi:hypothetical protein
MKVWEIIERIFTRKLVDVFRLGVESGLVRVAIFLDGFLEIELRETTLPRLGVIDTYSLKTY